MVIHQTATIRKGEEMPISYLMCQMPDEFHHRIGILTTYLFAGKGASTTAHHIQQHTIACLVIGLQCLLCPVL